MPYHDVRMPPELHRADYIVSANVGRTLQVCRQAVLDAKRAVDGLAARGYQHIGILGTSLGSCLSMLTAAHEPLIEAVALNHISPYFADVVWEGLSTSHVRQGLEGHIALDTLRALWRRSARSRTSIACARRTRCWSTRSTTSRSRSRCHEARPRLRRDETAARSRRAAVRPLQHGRLAVQMARRLPADEIPQDQSPRLEIRYPSPQPSPRVAGRGEPILSPLKGERVRVRGL